MTIMPRKDVVAQVLFRDTLLSIVRSDRFVASMTIVSPLVAIVTFVMAFVGAQSQLSTWLWVTGVVSICATIVFGVIFVKRHDDLELDHASYYEVTAQACGLAKDRIVREVQVEPDGGASSTYVFDIRSVGREVRSLKHYYEIPLPPSAEPNSDGIDLLRSDGNPVPNGEQAVIEGTANGKPYRLVQKLDSRGKHDVLYSLRIEPPLPPDQALHLHRPFEYHTKNTFFLTPEQLLEATPEEDRVSDRMYDFTSVILEYPASSLSITIRFPRGWVPRDCDFDVWQGNGQGRVRHLPEYQYLGERRKQVFQHISEKGGALRGLRLTVPYPLFGLTYAIRWSPDPDHRPSGQGQKDRAGEPSLPDAGSSPSSRSDGAADG